MIPNILSILIFLPLGGAVGLALPFFSGARNPTGTRARTWAAFIALLTCVLSVWLLATMESQNVEMQHQERFLWIRSFGIWYALGVDGISILLTILSTALFSLVVYASDTVQDRARGYFASILVLETSVLGILFSQDLLLFYVFWELMLAPMYFIIGIWGGKKRIAAALKFVLYTIFGSVLMLVAILFVAWRYYEQHGEMSFLLSELVANTSLTRIEEIWLFSAFALGFGIKVPIFPFHSWLPDAYTEAPTGGTILMSGILVKLGLYGFLRFAFPLFPRGTEVLTPLLLALAVIGIIYGALVAWSQSDMKRLVAYSSMSHLGYCALGIFALNEVATSGALFQMVSHGITIAGLFLLVGFLSKRTDSRLISDHQGIASVAPKFAAILFIITLGAIALPLTCGFVGEFMILIGTFKEFPWFATFGAFGVIFGALYMLSMYSRTMFGEVPEGRGAKTPDLTPHELRLVVPLALLVIGLGIFPGVLLNTFQPTLKSYLTLLDGQRSARIDREFGEMEDSDIENEELEEIAPALSIRFEAPTFLADDKKKSSLNSDSSL